MSGSLSLRITVDAHGAELVPALSLGGHATYREVVLESPLEHLADVWLSLRNIRECVEPGGVLTCSYGHSGPHALSRQAVASLLRLAHFDPVRTESHAGGQRVRARRQEFRSRDLSCAVIVPCRNEIDNVEPLVRRLPQLGSHTQLIFVDGLSDDGTPDRIRDIIRANQGRDITLLEQHDLGGKAGAVFQGFDAATSDILCILDADMTVAPEDLPRFYLALAEGVARFANGNRFAHVMERGAMPAANQTGNRMFSRLLSQLLGTPVGDTLCGTKAIFRSDWECIRQARSHFGNHDPWGDFDLLFGAAFCGLDIVDVPVPYYARVAGESKMRPLVHGPTLARTCWAGYRALRNR